MLHTLKKRTAYGRDRTNLSNPIRGHPSRKISTWTDVLFFVEGVTEHEYVISFNKIRQTWWKKWREIMNLKSWITISGQYHRRDVKRNRSCISEVWSMKMESGELTVEAEWTMKRLSVIVWIWRISYEGHDTKKIQKKHKVVSEK